MAKTVGGGKALRLVDRPGVATMRMVLPREHPSRRSTAIYASSFVDGLSWLTGLQTLWLNILLSLLMLVAEMVGQIVQVGMACAWWWTQRPRLTGLKVEKQSLLMLRCSL